MKSFSLIIIFSLLFFLPLQSALAQDQSDLSARKNLVVSLNISSSLLLSIEENGQIGSITATLGIVPSSDTHQKVLTLETVPSATENEDGYIYEWQNPSSEKIPIELHATVQTSLSGIPVREKVSFPLKNLDASLASYLQETEMIDYSNTAIQALANELAAGEDDSYVVAVKIADWVQQNISYNLTTLTAEAVQPASWVLENKYGVCDELTNLYIALLRSVGIPARFVVGVAYTNSPLFADPWNPHGWAEVYFPDYGWVPFDVTYGQYGFLDATHIKLHDALDANQAGISYEWNGRKSTVTSSGLDISVVVNDQGSQSSLPVQLTLSPLHTVVGFGSSTLLFATVTNTAQYYVPVRLAFAAAKELSVVGASSQTVLLGPKEEKTLFWILQVPELNPSYTYTFDALVSLFTNQTARTSFSADASSFVYSLDTLHPLIAQYQQEDQNKKSYNSEISLNCSLSSSVFYPENVSNILCSVSNQGNTPQTLSVCYTALCQDLFIGISASSSVSFPLSNLSIGDHRSYAIFSGKDVLKTAEISYTVLDTPTLEFVNMSIASAVSYGEQLSLSFVLQKTSFQKPSSILVTVQYGNKQQFAQFPSLSDSQQIDLVLNSTAFRRVQNTGFITIDYVDSLGNKHQKQESFVVTLTDLSFWQKIKFYLLDFF